MANEKLADGRSNADGGREKSEYDTLVLSRASGMVFASVATSGSVVGRVKVDDSSGAGGEGGCERTVETMGAAEKENMVSVK